MNNDSISRQAAIEAITGKIKLPDDEHVVELVREYVQSVHDKIVNLPSVVPKQKTGKWRNHRNDNGHNIADCDQCGETMQWFDDDIKPNFCANCGARMTEGEA